MALIRQANAKTMARDAVVLDLGDLKRQGDEIKARARAEAELIIARARTEREKILAGAAEQGQREGLERGTIEGRRQGQAEGRAEALAQARPQLARLEEAWTKALADFQQQREDMLAAARTEVLRLALEIARLVTRREVQAHPEVVVDQVAAVLALLSRPSRLVISIHPDDQVLVVDALPALSQRFPAATHIELACDPALERGSCIARSGADGQSSGGEIDASIATQLARIVETLLPVAGEVHPPAPDAEPSP